MSDWLPEPGRLTGLADAAIVVLREGEPGVHRVVVDGHRVGVAPADGCPPDAIVLGPGGSDAPPSFADGRPLPPFDEAPILEALPPVAGATISAVMTLEDSPFGARAFHYRFVDGRLAGLRLVAAHDPADEPGDGVDLTFNGRWDRWCLWRSGRISGEQFLEGAQVRGQWPFVALAQGLLEHDDFVAARRRLAPPAADLSLLQLLRW